MTSPLNALLGFSDEASAWIRCGNDHVWIAAGHLMKFLRGCANDSVIWDAMFDGSMLGLLPLPKRMNFHVPDSQMARATGDAALRRFPDAINWAAQEYVVADPVDFVSEINPVRRAIVIRDSEKHAPACVITLRGNPTASCRWGQTAATY